MPPPLMSSRLLGVPLLLSDFTSINSQPILVCMEARNVNAAMLEETRTQIPARKLLPAKGRFWEFDLWQFEGTVLVVVLRNRSLVADLVFCLLVCRKLGN